MKDFGGYLKLLCIGTKGAPALQTLIAVKPLKESAFNHYILISGKI